MPFRSDRQRKAVMAKLGEQKNFDVSYAKGIENAERYKRKLENNYDRVRVVNAGVDRVKIIGTNIHKQYEEIPTHELESINKRNGFHWFDRDTKSFFSSRWSSMAYKKGNDAYFISSEKKGFDRLSGRGYSIRKMDLKTGEIDTIGEFNKYSTRSQANTALNKILKQN